MNRSMEAAAAVACIGIVAVLSALPVYSLAGTDVAVATIVTGLWLSIGGIIGFFAALINADITRGTAAHPEA